MSCVTLNSEFWATQTPSRRLCLLPRPSILGCLVASKLDSRQNTQFMTDASIFFFYVFPKTCIAVLKNAVSCVQPQKSGRRADLEAGVDASQAARGRPAAESEGAGRRQRGQTAPTAPRSVFDERPLKAPTMHRQTYKPFRLHPVFRRLNTWRQFS